MPRTKLPSRPWRPNNKANNNDKLITFDKDNKPLVNKFMIETHLKRVVPDKVELSRSLRLKSKSMNECQVFARVVGTTKECNVTVEFNTLATQASDLVKSMKCTCPGSNKKKLCQHACALIIQYAQNHAEFQLRKSIPEEYKTYLTSERIMDLIDSLAAKYEGAGEWMNRKLKKIQVIRKNEDDEVQLAQVISDDDDDVIIIPDESPDSPTTADIHLAASRNINERVRQEKRISQAEDVEDDDDDDDDYQPVYDNGDLDIN